MARKSLTDRIAAQAARIAREKARFDQMVARDKKAARRLADRQKILIGAAVIGELERDPEFGRRIKQLLNVAMVRPHDRAALAHLLPEGSAPQPVNTDMPPDGHAEVETAAAAISAELDGLNGLGDETTGVMPPPHEETNGNGLAG